MKRLAAIFLCSATYAADPPFLPLASCDKGKCTMSESDYEKFQRFHRATFAAAVEQEKDIERLQIEVLALRAQVARSLHCQLRKV